MLNRPLTRKDDLPLLLIPFEKNSGEEIHFAVETAISPSQGDKLHRQGFLVLCLQQQLSTSNEDIFDLIKKFIDKYDQALTLNPFDYDDVELYRKPYSEVEQFKAEQFF